MNIKKIIKKIKKLILQEYKKRTIWYLLLIFFLIYSIGIFSKFGRMYAYGDEAHVVNSVLKFFRDFNFADPHAYAFPVTTILYIPFVALSFIGAFALGLVNSLAELKQVVIVDTYKFVPVFRFTTIIFSLITIYVFYRLCKLIFKEEKWALLGAYLIGTSFIFAKFSSIAIKWMPQLMLIVISLYYFFWLNEKKKWKTIHYIFAALIVAASYGVALVGLITLVPFTFILYKAVKEKRAGDYKKGIIYFIIILLLLLVLITTASPTLAHNRLIDAVRAIDLGTGEKQYSDSVLFRFFGYFEFLFKAELALMIFAVIGVFLAYRRDRFIFGLFISYFLSYYIVLGPLFRTIRQRRALMLIPAIVIFSIYAIKWVYAKADRQGVNRYVFILLVAFLINPYLIRHELAKADSNMVAKRWVEANIKENSIIFDTCPLELDKNKELIEYIREGKPDLVTTKQEYLLNHIDLLKRRRGYFVLVDWRVFTKEELNSLRDKHEQYFVLCHDSIIAEIVEERGKLRGNIEKKLHDEFKLEPVYVFADTVEHVGEKPFYPTYRTDPSYLIKSFKQKYNDKNVTIYKIE